MGKNHQIHIFLEKNLKELIKNEAKELGLSINEFCRFKLVESTKLSKIENKLAKIELLLKKLESPGGTKNGKNKSNR